MLYLTTIVLKTRFDAYPPLLKNMDKHSWSYAWDVP